MSFGNSYAGYQNAPGGDSTHEYNRLSSFISTNVHKITQNGKVMIGRFLKSIAPDKANF